MVVSRGHNIKQAYRIPYTFAATAIGQKGILLLSHAKRPPLSEACIWWIT
jgi:hypothetical protein